jgi:uncharacterized protein YdhG (YjbR/CyaY superfamily)
MASPGTLGNDAPAATIDDYIAGCEPRVRPILKKLRAIVRAEAPDAEETISYRMPAFKRHGVLIYFAAFTHHIGIYPPVKGNAAVERALAPYRGEKGNLRFPIDEPIPYDVIRRVVRARIAEQDRKRAARGR